MNSVVRFLGQLRCWLASTLACPRSFVSVEPWHFSAAFLPWRVSTLKWTTVNWFCSKVQTELARQVCCAPARDCWLLQADLLRFWATISRLIASVFGGTWECLDTTTICTPIYRCKIIFVSGLALAAPETQK